MFSGGRPVAALAKDCCYKNVARITEDVELLQRDKVELQKKLTECLEQNDKFFVKYKSLKEKNIKLEDYLKEIGDAALFVEREANLKIKNQHKEILELKECLMKCSDGQLGHDLRNMKKTIKEKNLSEEKMQFEIEYYKEKLKEMGKGWNELIIFYKIVMINIFIL